MFKSVFLIIKTMGGSPVRMQESDHISDGQKGWNEYLEIEKL
jgi:hypothetical protein